MASHRLRQRRVEINARASLKLADADKRKLAPSIQTVLEEHGMPRN
jgi:hypothetical protein